jgi:hypothetical protein
MNHGPADLPEPLLFFKEKENLLESFLFCLYDFGMRASAAYRISMMPFIPDDDQPPADCAVDLP